MIRKISREIAALGGQQLGERGAAARFVLGQDHLADVGDPLRIEEHVLGAAQADALGAELARDAAIVRGLGIGADPQAALASAQSISIAEIADQLGLDRRHLAEHHLAGACRRW